MKMLEVREYWDKDEKIMKALYHMTLDRMKQGEARYWFENGQLWQHCFFKRDKLDGEFKCWHSNGRLESHCFYNGELERKIC